MEGSLDIYLNDAQQNGRRRKRNREEEHARVCVFVCVHVWEEEREREKGWERTYTCVREKKMGGKRKRDNGVKRERA